MIVPSSPSVSISRAGSACGDRERTMVWLRGEHDVATARSVAASIVEAVQLDDSDLLIDLRAVTFMDASILGVIVGGRNRLRSRGRSLAVRAPSLPALRVLELCGLADLVEREPARSTGPAAALGTWVDVPIREVAVEVAAATVEAAVGGP